MYKQDIRHTQEITYTISVWDEERRIATLKHTTEFSYIEVDDSFEHEYGIKHESHWELFDEGLILSEMMWKTDYEIKKTKTLEMLIKQIYKQIIKDRLFEEDWSEPVKINEEIDIMDFILRERL